MSVAHRIRIGVAAIAVIGGGIWLVTRGGEAGNGVVASGTVEAIEADLGFQGPGRLETVDVREGDRVTAGQVLARLDAAELRARRDAAEAQRAASRAVLAELRAGSREEEIAQARAAVRAAERRVVDAQRELERGRRLFEGGAVSQQTLDNHQTALELAEADRDQATERLRAVERGPRAERVAAQAAAVQQAEAMVAQIDVALANAVLTAPFDGMVTIRHRERGEIVAPGAPVITVLDPAERWVRIYVREDQVGRVHVGDSAEIRGDADPDRPYTGIVSFIATEAEFTPRNVQTSEERVKLVFEVRVRITGDAEFDLKPGLAADVRLTPTTG